MEYRCKLYRGSDYNDNGRRYIDSDPLRHFDDILDDEASPFHDELSLEFMRDTYNISFSDNMHFVENESQFAIHNLSKSMKECLMLLRNSKAGIYTEVHDIYDAEWEYVRVFDKFDLLFAYNVECGEPHPIVTYFTPLVVENYPFKGTYVPVTIANGKYPDEKELVYKSGDWFELYHTAEGYLSGGNFFTQFEYDWKRDLPDIKWHIDYAYNGYKVLAEYEKRGTLFSIFSKPDYVEYEELMNEDNAEDSDYKVINHMFRCMKMDADSRRVAEVFFIYLKDGSVELYKTNSIKYPNMIDLLLEDHDFMKSMEYAFGLFVDVDETIRNTYDFDNAWFGAYFEKEKGWMELFDKDQALLEFAKQIPYVLEHMNVPIKGYRELEEYFKS